MDNQDLISFASPNPAQKKGGGGQFHADLESISFDNNNSRGSIEQKFKAVQNLFSTPSSAPPPPPPPRTVLPVVSPSGLVSYPAPAPAPALALPNTNRLGGFPGQPYQQNFLRTPSPLSNNINLPANQNAGLVRSAPGQSMFNQRPARPPAQQPSPAAATLSLQTPTSNYNQAGVQRANSAGGGFGPGPIPKSSSWNEDILTSTPKPHSAAPLRHTSPPPSIASSEVSGATRKKLQYKTRSQTDSLIELIPEGDAANTTTVSILHDFDPLNESDNEEEEEIYWSSQKSNFSESFYDTNDPFSYMEQQVSVQE